MRIYIYIYIYIYITKISIFHADNYNYLHHNRIPGSPLGTRRSWRTCLQSTRPRTDGHCPPLEMRYRLLFEIKLKLIKFRLWFIDSDSDNGKNSNNNSSYVCILTTKLYMTMYYIVIRFNVGIRLFKLFYIKLQLHNKCLIKTKCSTTYLHKDNSDE